MPCHQWPDQNGTTQIGTRPHVGGSGTARDALDDFLSDHDLDLMRCYHTGELVLVPSRSIKPYPSEPIPETK